jgi:NADH oxidase (H2O2-forming)
MVILGSGVAGYSAAKIVRHVAGKVDLTMISEEPDPTYSACVLAEFIAGEISRDRVFLTDTSPFEFASPHWMPGRRALRIDPGEKRLELESGPPLPFDRLILATGSRPRVPNMPGVDTPGVHCLKTLADAEAILDASGREAVVIGSGPVGLEVAVGLHRKGWRVSVVELLDRLLPRLFSPAHSQRLLTLLEEEGIRVRVGERVEAIEGRQRVKAVITDRGTLPCQLVLMGIGMLPETRLAQNAGIKIGAAGGIAVNPYMETSEKGILACGDCVETLDRLTGEPGLHMLWGNAKMQGAIAGWNSLGFRKKYPGALNITTMKLFDTEATSVGEVTLRDESYREVLRSEGERPSLRLVVRDGLIKGIQSVGPRKDLSVFMNMMLAGDRLDIVQRSVNRRLLLEQKPWLVRLPPSFRE